MTERAFAILGLFDSADALVAAVIKLKSQNLAGRLEAYTPYPVHGIEKALGLRRSPLGGMVMVMGVLGATVGFLFQWWMSAVDYPLVTGGKALASWQAFVPIMFEITVLFAALTAGLGMLLLLNKLPHFAHPVLSSDAIAAITRDKFALAVETDETGLDENAARAALAAAGAQSIESLPPEKPAPPFSPEQRLRTMLCVAGACAVAGYGTYWGIKLFPVLPPVSHMQEQPKLAAQEPSAFFLDGRGMRSPVAGTVARGGMPYPFTSKADAAVLANPLPRTPEVLRKGKAAYAAQCAVCHGALGDGVSTLTAAYGAKPANLQARAYRAYPDGGIFHAITMGAGAMPSYAAALDEDGRWAVVHYVRSLQRASRAKEEDLP